MTATLILGLVLGGAYALTALGLTLQFGIARILNLAHGEVVIAGAFAAYVLHEAAGVSPLISLALAAPAGFAFSWIVYGLVLRPLAKRAPTRGALEADSILATFGLLFVIQGAMLMAFGGNFAGYTFLNEPVRILGAVIAANRLIAFGLAAGLGLGLYLLMTRTRWGTALRAVADNPGAAHLVGIDVDRSARIAFALGGALAACGGVAISMFQTFTAASGVVFTMKALVVVIMGGVGNLLGSLVAGAFLGLAETFVAAYVDPGLTLAATYALFLAILLWRPSGLFGRSAA